MSKLLVHTVFQLDYDELTRNIGAELDAARFTNPDHTLALLDNDFQRLKPEGCTINLGHVRNYEAFLDIEPVKELWARECCTRRSMDGPKVKDPDDHYFKLVDALACLFALGYFKDNPVVSAHTSFLVRR